MGKMFKKIMSITLIVSMILGSAYTFEADKKTVYAAENSMGNISDYAQIENALTVSSDTSMGELIADKLSQTGSEQQSNNGYNVFSVTVEGKSAEAEFECASDAQLIVAIYSEDGTELKGMGRVDVKQSDKNAKIDINIDTLPEYFLVKAFIIDDTMSSMGQSYVSTMYESSMYTKEMQELVSKTTDDFDKNKVLNLDSDKTNNFAVYKDDVTRLSSGNSNTLVSYDTDKGMYIFSNVNSNITQLKKDDILAYDNNGTEIIIKVDRINVNGNNVVIYGKDTSLEEVFDYVKIDDSQDVGKGTFDTTNMQAGVEYNGMSDYTDDIDTQSDDDYSDEEGYPEALKAARAGGEGSYEKEADFKFKKTPVKSDDNNYSEIDGELKLAAKAGIKVYVTLNYQYVEVKLDMSAYFMLSLTEKLGGDIKLGELGFSPCPGVNVGFVINVVIRADVNLKVSGKLECTVGFSYGSTEGFRNISTTPTFNSRIEMSGKIYIGLSLETKITVISEKIAKAWMKGEAGAEIEANADFDRGKEGEYIHDCLVCIDGEIYAKIHVSAGLKFFDNDNISVTKDIVKIDKIPIADFYFSCTYGDGGWGKCPHNKYRVNLVVVNNIDDNIHDTQIVIDGKDKYTLSRKNSISIYIPNGEHDIVYSKYGYNNIKKTITINGNTSKQYVRLTNVSGDKENKIVDVQGSLNRYAVITEAGDLYMAGSNSHGQLGDGTKKDIDSYSPKKIMKNIVSVSCSNNHTAAITEDGSLYMWGYNKYGELGDGTNTDSYVPKKIMDDVVYVCLDGDKTAAITENGDLYIWGSNYFGEIGDGTYTNKNTPQKRMEKVINVNMKGYCVMAITQDGDLYMWGYNRQGQIINNPNYESERIPVKVMEKVIDAAIYTNASAAITEDGSLYRWGVGYSDKTKIMDNTVKVSIGTASAAITKEGSLYMWGTNSSGELGDGNTQSRSNPIKVIEKVAAMSQDCSTTAVITEEGSLYIWGSNYGGIIGDGTIQNKNTPTKIMDNVAVIRVGSAAITKDGELYMWGSKKNYSPVNIRLKNTISLFNNSIIDDNTQYININSTNFTQNGKVTRYIAPDSEYMMYVLQSVDEQEDLLSLDNIVYIDQITTDNTGKMEYEYNPLWGDAHVIIIGRDKNVEYDNSLGYAKGIKEGLYLTDLDDVIYKRYTYSSNTDGSGNCYVKTGDTLNLLDSKGNCTHSYTICIKGDVDGNGSIDVLDMETIQKSILGIGDKLSGAYKEAASLSDGDDITVLDMEAIQKDILGIQKIN